MTVISTKLMRPQDLNDSVQMSELRDILGIYSWHLCPTITSYSSIGSVISKSSFHRRIHGRDEISREKMIVEVNKKDLDIRSEKFNLSNIKGNAYALNIFSELAGDLAPPIYIGMSGSLRGRLNNHLRELRKAFLNMDVDPKKNHFGQTMIKYSEDLKRAGVISRDLRMADLQLKVYVFDKKKIDESQVAIIENALITLFSPIGNKKYLK